MLTLTRCSLLRLLGVSSLLVSAAPAAESIFRSGPAPVALIELYTSEGCSSCPPAEKWLGALRHDAGLWTRFVPVAFHVNYWDHLGWRDALATKAFTEREHAYAAAWRASSVYTPCFVRNGDEWRPRDLSTDKAPATAADAGVLIVAWDRTAHRATITFIPAAGSVTTTGMKRPEATAFEGSVALLGGGIVQAVRKGENSGRTLHHEFVALRLETTRLIRSDASGWTAQVTLPPRAEIASSRLALAAWVTRAGQLAPLQATGGWIN